MYRDRRRERSPCGQQASSLTTIYLLATLDGIRPGLEGRLERAVEGELITRHVGGAGTFATPAMIGLMEITSHRSVENLLPEGWLLELSSKKLRISRDDAFGLLLALGSDCVGAVEIAPVEAA